MSTPFVLVVGPPASGKTGLVERVLEQLGPPSAIIQERVSWVPNCNWAKGTLYPKSRVLVLGVYDGSLYAGTDKLGRNVSPAVASLVKKFAMDPVYEGWSILAEGDRVTTYAFLSDIQNYVSLFIVRLAVPEGLCSERQAYRTATSDAEWIKTAPKKVANKPRRAGRSQGVDKTWVRGRLRKLDNLCDIYADCVLYVENNNPNDRERNAQYLLRLLQPSYVAEAK